MKRILESVPFMGLCTGGGEIMNCKRLSVILILIFIFFMGCSGTYGKFKRQSDSEAKATKRELVDNWSDYDIWLHHHPGYKPPRLTIIIFDTKNDDKKILVKGSWSKVNDQQTWTEIVNENTDSDGEFTLAWANWGPYYTTGVQEIWGPDNQLYGFVVYQEYAVSLVRLKSIDENTIQFSWSPPRPVGGR